MELPTNHKSFCNITKNTVRKCCILFLYSFLFEICQNKTKAKQDNNNKKKIDKQKVLLKREQLQLQMGWQLP